MRRRCNAGPLIIIAGLVIATASAAGAEPIRVVTSGTIATIGGTGSMNGTFSLFGEDFSLTGLATDGIGNAFACQPCAVGETVNFTSGWGGDISGNTHSVVNGVSRQVWLGGEISLMGGSVVVPPGQGSTLILTAPFHLSPTSRVIGFADSQRTTPVFDFRIGGSGVATLTAQGNGALYDSGNFTFVFSGSQTAPTPEPGTILLMLTGLAGIARIRQSRAVTAE